MKKGFLCILLLTSLVITTQAQNSKSLPVKQYQPAVLIELFSSEGCSSCPFASKFLKEVIDISDSSKTPVFVIDYHVDIWNRSGWVDPFSDSIFSMRQQEYVYRKKLTSMYTPMVFVNGGDKDFAGADKRAIGNAIQGVLTQPSNYYLRTGVTAVENEDSLLVAYQIWGELDSFDLRVAFIQKEINNQVKGGENAGMILHHHNVVKQLTTRHLTNNEGFMKIPVNRDLNLDNFRMVVFVQHQRTWKVVATDQLTFKP
jgi:hypothetical protein